MYLLIVLLPLISAITAGLFGRFIGREGSKYITTGSIMVTCAMSYCAFYEVALLGQPCHFDLMTWIDSEMFSFSWGFLFDSLTVVMLVVVTSVSSLVHLYSTEYMGHDPHLPRFMSYLSLFTFFMLILVTADNFLQMFVGWEGVGLCSYLLIGYWYQKAPATHAAFKAFITNRVSDLFLILAIAFLFNLTGSISFESFIKFIPGLAKEKTYLFWGLQASSIDIAACFLLVGAMGKSAQILFHVWLPDAMEGPTPVSALIHAATMVTAGVFLLLRFSFLYVETTFLMPAIQMIGLVTMLFAGMVALAQNDIKRIIAYSTCSQLGLMFVAFGSFGFTETLFHLFVHACFKALLFLMAGCVIMALGHQKDIRKMGGFAKKNHRVHIAALIGILALTGVPFFSGYHSKNMIMSTILRGGTLYDTVVYGGVIIGIGLTIFYSWRLFIKVFYGKYLGPVQTNKIPNSMYIAIGLLSILSVGIGMMLHTPFLRYHFPWQALSMPTPVSDFEQSGVYTYFPTVVTMILSFVAIIVFYKNFIIKFF